MNTNLLVGIAAIVIVVCGVVWLFGVL